MSVRLTAFCAACTFRRLTYRFRRSAGVNSGGALTHACAITSLSAWASGFVFEEPSADLGRRSECSAPSPSEYANECFLGTVGRGRGFFRSCD